MCASGLQFKAFHYIVVFPAPLKLLCYQPYSFALLSISLQCNLVEVNKIDCNVRIAMTVEQSENHSSITFQLACTYTSKAYSL